MNDPDGIQRCESFPQGIPGKIWDEYFNHTKPLSPADKILFTPRDGVTEEDVAEWEKQYVQQVLAPSAEKNLGPLMEEEPVSE